MFAFALLILSVAQADDATVEVPSGDVRLPSEQGGTRSDFVSSFRIDRTEVTVEAYAKCVEAGKCTPPGGEPRNWGVEGREKYPVDSVTWEQAHTYCAWRGARLPTDAQWQLAAAGPDANTYPWGMEPPDDRACWDGDESAAAKKRGYSSCPVGSFPTGASPAGALDMAGNIAEWVADRYSNDGATAPDPSGKWSVTRGGSWTSGRDERLRTRERWIREVTDTDHRVGFRCAS